MKISCCNGTVPASAFDGCGLDAHLSVCQSFKMISYKMKYGSGTRKRDVSYIGVQIDVSYNGVCKCGKRRVSYVLDCKI